MEKQNIKLNSEEPVEFSVCEELEGEVDVVELFYLLWGHMLQIIVCLLLGGAATFIFTYFLITPQYQATAKIYVVSASSSSIVNLSDLQLGAQLTADYQELLLSRPLLEDVIESLSLDVSPKYLDDFIDTISIESPEDTRILSITVENPDPQLAADIANEIARQAVIFLPRIMESPTPNIYEEAIAPIQKSGPSYSRNTLVGALVAAMVYCSVLVIRFLMNDTFVTPDDISKYFGVQPLAVIPEKKFKNKSRHSGKASRSKQFELKT